MAGIMVISAVPSTVYAANTEDEYWSFYVDKSVMKTPAREKENSSSVYVNLQKAPGGYVQAAAEGYVFIDGEYAWYNMTWNRIAVLPSVGKWRIRQTIYENGGRQAKLMIWKYAEKGIASGVWSPDCAGTYPYLN